MNRNKVPSGLIVGVICFVIAIALFVRFFFVFNGVWI